MRNRVNELVITFIAKEVMGAFTWCLFCICSNGALLQVLIGSYFCDKIPKVWSVSPVLEVFFSRFVFSLV